MIIFNEAKPKYEKLDELLADEIINIRFSNQVNILVDLKEVFRKFFRPDIDPLSQPRKTLIEEISADILNIIGHYRNYFYKKNKYSTFYFLYSKEKCEEIISEYPDYKKDYYEKYFSEDPKSTLIKSVNKVLEKIIEVIPNAYYIETSKFDEFVYGKYIISKCNDNELNIILTNDTLFYQLASPNTRILTLKGINSEIVNEKNAVSILTRKETDLPATIIPFLLSISGLRKYNIKSITNIALGKALRITEHLKETEKLQLGENIEFPIKFEDLDKNNKLEKNLILYKETFTRNYEFIKEDKLLYSNLFTIQNAFVEKKKIGSQTYFSELNSKIFTMFPLNLDMILKGERL